MAHFAELNDESKVIRVIVVSNNELLIDGVEREEKGIEFCQSLLGGTWLQTSYNNNIRKQYAGVGYTYDETADVFIAPKPFASWSLDSNYDWQAPVERPADGKDYSWDETNQVWVELPGI
jgi:hypothetical protein